jgi:hypothetical protein
MDNRPNIPPTDPDWYLSKLGEMVSSLEGAPRWEGIVMIDGFVASEKIHRNELYEPESFKLRFKEVVTSGHTWVNLSAAGVLEGKLLISLEDASDRAYEGCPTSVNLSGPFNFVGSLPGWSLDNLVEYVD